MEFISARWLTPFSFCSFVTSGSARLTTASMFLTIFISTSSAYRLAVLGTRKRCSRAGVDEPQIWHESIFSQLCYSPEMPFKANKGEEKKEQQNRKLITRDNTVSVTHLSYIYITRAVALSFLSVCSSAGFHDLLLRKK